jgi:hypothetical protein
MCLAVPLLPTAVSVHGPRSHPQPWRPSGWASRRPLMAAESTFTRSSGKAGAWPDSSACWWAAALPSCAGGAGKPSFGPGGVLRPSSYIDSDRRLVGPGRYTACSSRPRSLAGNRRSGQLEPFDCMPGALPPGDDEPATPAPVTVPDVVSMPTCAGCGPARWPASPLRRP